MAYYRLNEGSHIENGIRYFAETENNIISSNHALDKMFPERFTKVLGDESQDISEDVEGAESIVTDTNNLDGDNDVRSDVSNDVAVKENLGVALKTGDFMIGDKYFGRKGAFGRFYVFDYLTGEQIGKGFKNQKDLIRFVEKGLSDVKSNG